MMRRLKLLLWFVFGLVLGGAATWASAETIPATLGPSNNIPATGFRAGSNPIVYPSRLEACEKYFCNTSACPGAVIVENSGGITGHGQCRASWYSSGWITIGVSCPAGTSGYQDGFCSGQVYSCPLTGGWTLSGSLCTRPDCSAGQIRDPASGVCINDCNGAAAKAVNGQYVSGAGPSPAAGSLCVGGCFYGHDTCGSWSSGGVQKYVCRTTSATGQNCSGTGVTQASAAEAACAAQGQGTGTINGITVCAGKFESQKTEAAKTETKVNPDTTTDTKSTTSSTECKDGKCTTTTTETIVIGGGAPQTTTKTEEQPIADYCTKNPLDPQCVGKEEEDTCTKFPDRLDCKELGTAPQADPVQTQDKGIGNITQYTTAAGSCPADVALPHGATWDFGPVCDLAQSVRPIVIALGWLFAGLMIFGYFRS